MAGRYIGENIRIIYDLFYYAEKENIPRYLLLIDFENLRLLIPFHGHS